MVVKGCLDGLHPFHLQYGLLLLMHQWLRSCVILAALHSRLLPI